MGMWWPKAIHEGNGVARIYIDPRATAAQKKAIEEIASGKHGGGVWEIFPKTFARVHPTKEAKIRFNFKGYNSGFSVEGIGEVRSTHIRNPVTGEKFEGQIVLPGGINWRKADVTAIERWWLHDGEFQMEHANAAGFVCTMKFTEKGPA